MVFLFYRLSTVFLLSLFFGLRAFAQETNTAQQLEVLIERSNQTFFQIDRTLNADMSDDAALVSARGKLESLQSSSMSASDQITTQLKNIDKEVVGLGPEPEREAAPEPQLVAERRLMLAAQRSTFSVLSTRINDLNGKIENLIDLVAEQRRNLFANALVKRTPLDTKLFGSAFKAAQSEIASLKQLVSGWWRFNVQQKTNETLFSTLAALVVALALVMFARVATGRVFQHKEDVPTYFSKLACAFWKAVLPSLSFIAFFVASYGFYTYFDIFTPKIDLIVTSLFPVLAGIFLVRNLALAVFAPREPDYRLIAMPDRSAKQMAFLTIGLAVVNGADIFIGRLNEVVSAPLSLTVFKSLIAASLIGILLLAIAQIRGREIEVNSSTKLAGWSSWISVPITLIGLAIILAAFAGYIGLARFVSQQIVITGAILATIYIGFLIGREIGKEGVFVNTSLGQHISKRFNLQPEVVEQISVLLSLLTIMAVFALGLPLLFLQWGSQWEDISFWIGKIIFGFEIGSVTLSLATLFIAVGAFIAVYILMQVLRRWLDKNVLVRSRMDTGVQDSIKTGIGYLGLGLALLFAVTTAGIDLSSLAIVAGALSLGIGFGLQNIVSNFVSGLILLIERPIKVGDWVEVSGTSGYVKKISVRATEITTHQSQSVIVPNSELINSTVGNWTHKDKGGRIDVPIGVAYGTDTRFVESVLLDIVKDSKDILKSPEPFVIFIGFGDSSLDFGLRFFVRDIRQGVVVASSVRHAIAERFTAENIEIPFPQRDLHLITKPDELEVKLPKGK